MTKNGAPETSEMSSSASSRSKPPDIIDLDRYIRASVHPSRPTRRIQRCSGVPCGDLVVDAGGVGQVRMAGSSSGDGSYQNPEPTPIPHQKRFSHDSGVSDSTYVKRRQRQHKRYIDSIRSRESSKHNGSSSSMRQFRITCEKSLREQQQQISRVAELCERLALPNNIGKNKTKSLQHSTSKPPSNDGNTRKPGNQELAHDSMTDSSDTWSSQNRDVTRKEHRSDSCKTYKLIMNRLDDLNRVIAARHTPHKVTAQARLSTVTVYDKLVATEPLRSEGGNSLEKTLKGPDCGNTDTKVLQEGEQKRVLAVARATAFDIIPGQVKRGNTVTESVIRRSSGSSEQLTDNLDDPIRRALCIPDTSSSTPWRKIPGQSNTNLPDDRRRSSKFYAQAKRLQALRATTRCDDGHSTLPEQSPGRAKSAGANSLCQICRVYWKAVRNCIKQSFRNS